MANRNGRDTTATAIRSVPAMRRAASMRDARKARSWARSRLVMGEEELKIFKHFGRDWLAAVSVTSVDFVFVSAANK